MSQLNDVYEFCQKCGYKARIVEGSIWFEKAITTPEQLKAEVRSFQIIRYCITIDEDDPTFLNVFSPARLNKEPSAAETLAIYHLTNTIYKNYKVAKVVLEGRVMMIQGEAFLASKNDYETVLSVYMETIYHVKQKLMESLPSGLRFEA